MTDHGNLYGAYDFWSKATKAGIKPIIGIEAYVAPEHRRHRQPVRWGTPAQKDDDVSGAGAYTHMTLLAETTEGMHNLFRLSSRASLEGYFRKPRMDRELIAEHARGIIATTGCPSGEVQTRLRLGQYPQALQAAADYRDIFGPGNFFVEIMDHGLSIEQRVRDGLRRIAKELDLPFVVTNDSHYTVEADAKAHEVLLCVQTGSNMADPGRFRFDGSGYYLKTPQEMRAAFPDEEWQSGCDSTLLIAERADVAFETREPDAAVRRPRGGDRGELAAPGSLARHGPPVPRRLRRAPPPAGRVRDGHHHPDGLLLVLPGRRGLHHVGQAERDLGRPGPRLGRGLPGRLRPGHHRPGPAGARADLRAVPEPRTRVHARHRHRLRRTPAG